jgi:predicted Ser/Thr protein kinase
MEDLAVSLKCPHTKELTESNIRKILDSCREEIESGQKKPTAGMTTVLENMHFRDFNKLDASTQRQLASQMTPNQFTRLTKEYDGHQRAIDLGKTMFTGMNKVGIGFNVNLDAGRAKIGVHGGADAIGKPFEQHLERQQTLNSRTMSTLINSYSTSHKGAGGADTSDVALAKSTGDTGPWLAKNTWFGLIPGTNLPRLAQSGL